MLFSKLPVLHSYTRKNLFLKILTLFAKFPKKKKLSQQSCQRALHFLHIIIERSRSTLISYNTISINNIQTIWCCHIPAHREKHKNQQKNQQTHKMIRKILNIKKKSEKIKNPRRISLFSTHHLL